MAMLGIVEVILAGMFLLAEAAIAGGASDRGGKPGERSKQATLACVPDR